MDLRFGIHELEAFPNAGDCVPRLAKPSCSTQALNILPNTCAFTNISMLSLESIQRLISSTSTLRGLGRLI